MGAPFTLMPIEQVLLLFLHLRHYSAQLLIATIYGVVQQTVSNELQRTIPFFYTLLSRFVTMDTLDTRIKQGRKLYNEIITYILDGTEQPCHSSNDMFQEGKYYSGKKNQHSITILIIISPDGRVLHISPCTYGSVVDSELVQRSRSQWQHQLTEADVGLGDSGFKGMDKYGLKIYTPRPGSHAHPIYRIHSTIRIKVENIIRVHKVFECLHAEIREKIGDNEAEFLRWHTMRWRTVGGVLNLNKYGWDQLD
jgi:DDE superfamily endonuclease/Helix-turn-helix of DDE superfamily endonuclease